MKKSKKKVWTCNNQCLSNCCSYIYIQIDYADIEKLEKERFMPIYHYIDKKWLFLREGLDFSGKDWFKIPENIEFKLYYHLLMRAVFVYMEIPCSKLLENHRCKIYRTRPNFCKTGPCLMNVKDQSMFSFSKKMRDKGGLKLVGLNKVGPQTSVTPEFLVKYNHGKTAINNKKK